MENVNNDFYQQFLQALREKATSRGKLCGMLTNILNIERISVYRRLRGTIPFTFSEIIAISRQLNISLDNIINVTSPYRNMPFQLYNQNFFHLSEKDYKMSEDYIEAIKVAAQCPNSEYGAAANILPLHLMVLREPIYRFFILKWMYQFGSNDEILPFEQIKMPQRLSRIHADYIQEVKKIKHTIFFFYEFSLVHLVRDIKYFRSVYLLTDNDVALLKSEIEAMVDILDKIIRNGCYDNGNSVDIYLSGLNLETSYTYLASKDVNLTMIDAFTLGALTSTENKPLETMKRWIHALKLTSTVITGSEKNRIAFIEKQREILRKLN